MLLPKCPILCRLTAHSRLLAWSATVAAQGPPAVCGSTPTCGGPRATLCRSVYLARTDHATSVQVFWTNRCVGAGHLGVSRWICTGQRFADARHALDMPFWPTTLPQTSALFHGMKFSLSPIFMLWCMTV